MHRPAANRPHRDRQQTTVAVRGLTDLIPQAAPIVPTFGTAAGTQPLGPPQGRDRVFLLGLATLVLAAAGRRWVLAAAH